MCFILVILLEMLKQIIMKINFKARILYFILILPFLCSACLTHVEEDIEAELTAEELCATVTFSLNVKPIIEANCIQCHGSSGQFPELTTYNSISANAALVKAETVSRRMPQGNTLTNDEINTISCWVDNGALNN